MQASRNQFKTSYKCNNRTSLYHLLVATVSRVYLLVRNFKLKIKQKRKQNLDTNNLYSFTYIHCYLLCRLTVRNDIKTSFSPCCYKKKIYTLCSFLIEYTHYTQRFFCLENKYQSFLLYSNSTSSKFICLEKKSNHRIMSFCSVTYKSVT